jgi:hypothetical protein
MQIDNNPLPVHTVELQNPKILIWQNRAESTKGKNVIIGEPRSEQKKKSLEASSKSSTLGARSEEGCQVCTDRSGDWSHRSLWRFSSRGARAAKKDGSAQTGLIGLTGLETGLTGHYESS